MVAVKEYEVTATRWERGWELDIDGVGVTQSRTLRDAEERVRDYLRLDTPSATYFASNEATFSVETDVDGNDRVTVFDGSIEVRTPDRKTRLRRGEGAQIDDRGDFDLTGSATLSADDFERWFLRRTERYGAKSGRYLDRSLAYYEDELSRHGSWVNIGTYGWAWRPTVAAGWRPYYHGQWGQGRNGHLTWVSYEPWGWSPPKVKDSTPPRSAGSAGPWMSRASPKRVLRVRRA